MHFAPDDIQALADEFFQRPMPNYRDQSDRFEMLVRVADSLEPGLVFASPAQRVGWVQWTATARKGMRLGDETKVGHSAGQVAHELNALVAACWRGNPSGPLRAFAFMASARLRGLAERDWRSLEAVRKADESRLALVVAGSLIEGVLLDVLEDDPAATLAAGRAHSDPQVRGPFNGKSAPSTPEDIRFHLRIAVAGAGGLKVLAASTEMIAQQARDWRNFIHPHLERQEVRPPSVADAALAQALADKVLEDVETWRRVNPATPRP